MKIKFIKDYKDIRSGEIVESSKDSASNFVSQGYAEYIDEKFAFSEFEKINSLETVQTKHREWLKKYEGLHYGFGVDGKMRVGHEWTKTSYKDSKFDTSLNYIGERKDRVKFECDGDLEKAKQDLEKAKQNAIENEFGFILSDHKGKSPYLWFEFNRDLTDREKEQFLLWLAPEGAKVDLNFASSKKIFPVLFAPHGKHSLERELPIEFHKGNKIDFDSLKIKPQKISRKKEIKEDGYEYETGVRQEEKEISFNFEFIHSEIKNLIELEKVIKENFPSVWFETKACASLYAAMSLKNLNGCPSLNLIGSPSGEKTTVLSFFYNHNLSYLSDDFTPRAFVSHAANVNSEELESVDLLPKIKNKVLISPELAPLFEAPKEKLLDNFAILTRVLDGEGLNRDTGVHGHRGYSGDYKFGWLGASTPLRASVWNIMGKIGNRLFFLNMRDKNRDNKDFIEMFRGKAYEEKIKTCRGAVKGFLDSYFSKYPVRSLEWDAEQDIFILQEIIKYAQLLSKLRGTLMVWRSEDGDYQHSFPIIEEPPRAINSLYNFAKGHALINGRTFLRNEDLELVREIAFSSMPHDRFEFLKLLIKHEGRLTTQNIQKELNCSDESARKTMKIFEILGVVTIKSLPISLDNTGRPMYFVEIKPEFSKILSLTQVLKDLEKSNPSQIKSVYDDFSAEEFTKIQNTDIKFGHTHPIDGLEKSNPSEKNPVFKQKTTEIDNEDVEVSEVAKDIEQVELIAENRPFSVKEIPL